MKELENPCKTCVHKTVCSYLAQTARIIANINTDIQSGNYPGNVILHISCVDYIKDKEVSKMDTDTYF